MNCRFVSALAVVVCLIAFSQQPATAQVLQSQANPVPEQHAAARIGADGKQAPDRDDPRARLESQIQENGAPTVAYTRQLHALRLNQSSAARALSPAGRGIHGAAAAVAGVPAWVPIGPTGANTQQNGGSTLFTQDSGRARTILPDPANADHLYFLTSGGGLWVTNNFTAATPTWTPLTDSLPTTGGGSVTFGRNTLTLYLGTGDPFDVINTGGSVTKSTDGGVTWSVPVDLGTAQSVRDIKIDTSTANDIVLAATDVGLFRSIDGGATFTQPLLSGVTTGIAVWSIVKTNAGWLANAQPCAKVPADLCASTSTIYLSTDLGATWNPAGTGFTTAGRATLAVGTPGSAIVYAFAENSASTDQLDLFKSIDGGANFTALGINIKTPTNAAGNTDQPKMDLMHGQSWYNQMIVVDPTDSNIVYLGGDLSTAKTTDGGITWTLTSNWLAQFGLAYVHADSHAAAIIPNTAPTPNTVIFGNDGGIFVSADSGAHFVNKNAGLQTHLIYSLSSSPSDPSGIIAGFQDVGTRSRVGNSTIYNQIIGGDGLGTAWSQNGAFAMGSVEVGGIFPNVSPEVADEGESWDAFNLPNASTEGLFNTSMATPSLSADPTGLVLFSYTGQHVYKSANAGATWTTIGTIGTTGLTAITGFRSTTHGISVGPIDQLHIAVAGPNGNLALTPDGGTTWNVVAIATFVSGFANISNITWADNSTLYVTSESPLTGIPRVVKSIDGGATWALAATNLPDVQVNRIIVDPRDATHNTLLAATELGVFESTNGGTSWALFGTGLPNVRVNDIYMPPDGSFIRIATYGRGIWEMPSLSFKSASLTDDGTSCDHDGSLDNNETGHLTIVLHNDSGTSLSAITGTVTSTNAGISFPSGATVSFPAAAPGADTTASVLVALAGATGIQNLTFKISFNDTTLNLTAPVTATASFRGNSDVVANSLTSDDFEAPTSVWTTTGTAENIPDVFSWHNLEFSALDHRWVGIDNNGLADTSLVSPPLVLGPTGPFSFTFSQRYVFDNFQLAFFDGGVVEISQNGGAFQDVTTIGGTLSPGYDQTIAAGGGNVLTGRLAFAGVSANYPTMFTDTVTLPASVANQTIKVRFRIGTDASNGASGWTIDNFAFTGLANKPFPAVVADQGNCTVAAATTTAVTSNANPSTVGSSVTFTATVTGGTTTPTGTVTFKDGATSIGTGTLTSGQTTLSTSALAVGSHSITAVFGGDAAHQASTSTAITQVVNAVSTTTAVTSSLNPSTAGQSVTFTATVTSTPTATGTVTFNDGATTLGTGTLNAAGIATLSTAALSPATHSITAVYGGDATHAGSTSAILSQVVNGTATATTTALTSSLNPSGATQSVTFTATVTGGATPTGNVTFSDGATALGTTALNASGVATFSSTTLAVGTHSITALYAGDATHSTSTSTAVSQVVTAISTTAALTSSLNPSNTGQSVTFTATVTGGATPTGNVTFNDGATSIGSSALNASGVATLSTSTLALGTHSITAAYAGDAIHSGSTSTAASQVVNAPPAPPDYKVTADKTSVTLRAGQSATFTITAQSLNGYAGTVNFACNNLPQLTTCSFTPASVSVSGTSTTVTSTLVVKTTGPNASLTFPALHQNRIMYAMAGLLPFGFGFVFIGGSAATRRKRVLLTMVVLAVVAFGIVGCGGNSTPPVTATPAGTTAFSVSSTSAGTPAAANPSQNLSITIVVQP